MTAHTDRHDATLRALSLGELDPGSNEGRARIAELEACAECAVPLAELREAASLLDQARTELDTLAGAAAEPVPGLDEEGIVARFARAARGSTMPRDATRGTTDGESGQRDDAPRASPSRAGRWWLAAAVVLAALGAWSWLHDESTPASDDAVLGPSDVTCLSPVGEATTFDTFAWRSRFETRVHYALRIYDSEYSLLLGVGPLGETSWQPDTEQLGVLPDAIVWEVDVLDATAAVIASASATASRSSR